ncbi:MAG: hypothetical protein JSS22_11035 [Proteobacteria bacterium]|nr:hypothetical protein [Pseudomonadota bacterium]
MQLGKEEPSLDDRLAVMRGDDRIQPYAGLKHPAKVHGFRIGKALLAWCLIVAAFYYRPDFIKVVLRAGTRGIEAIGDALPYPWGDRIEIVLRELGGFIWLQITAFIIVIRLLFSGLAAMWRRR